jgi:hypothetical protein
VDERPAAVSSTELVEDLFRKEYAHLVSALTRVLGPSNVPLPPAYQQIRKHAPRRHRPVLLHHL